MVYTFSLVDDSSATTAILSLSISCISFICIAWVSIVTVIVWVSIVTLIATSLDLVRYVAAQIDPVALIELPAMLWIEQEKICSHKNYKFRFFLDLKKK